MERKVMPNIKMYKRHIHILWWTNRWIHIKFIARELTSICVAAYSLILLFFVKAVLTGPESYEAMMSFLVSPLAIIIHVLLLGGLLFHSITWFNLAPKAMVIKMGDKNIPGILIALANYVGWFVISILLFVLILNV
ncbi:hypothetical protein [Aquiflexum sp.]|uniref:hypothetical protein n=1 Tax=Aquiflexum sp. TaxID=1872584 RepID=UPI003592FC7D